MRSLRKSFALSIVFISFGIIGANAQNSTRSDRPIEQQIFRKILYSQNYGVFDFISFELQGTTVTLSGKVNSLGVISDAERSVKDVTGVTNVINNIEQLPPSPFDDEIRHQALRTFDERGPSQYFGGRTPDVRIIVENGRLTLEGHVTNKSHSDVLYTLANGISGVFSVQNNLVVGKDAMR